MPPLNPDSVVTGARPVPNARKRRKQKVVPPPDRDAQARSFLIRRRLQQARRIVLLTLVGTVVVGGGWAWQQGTLQNVVAQTRAVLPTVSDMPGMLVGRVDISGAEHVSHDAVMAAAEIASGQNIAELSLSEVRERVEALGWVKTAQVSRLLPDTVRIKIIERVPFALWQYEGRIRLIDGEGVEIADQAAGFEHLPMVVDLGAPGHAAELFEMLQAQPALALRVIAAVRVGDRRWNIRFRGGIDVQLPETDPEAAWHRLATLQRHQGILDRDIIAVDLRLPDRLTVRQTPDAAQARRDADSTS
ncbi:MAG: cell division protein FtsQ/DivIB [Alphaproteobacteria bacterium]